MAYVKEAGLSVEECNKCMKKEILNGILICNKCNRWYPIIDEISPRSLLT